MSLLLLFGSAAQAAGRLVGRQVSAFSTHAKAAARRAHFFPLFHTGEQTTTFHMATRRRRVAPKSGFQWRKLARFVQWHVPEPDININTTAFSSRPRRVTPRASFRWRKLARFMTWHVPVPDVNINAVAFQSRPRRVAAKDGRRHAWFAQWHTGSVITFNQNILALKTRKRSRRRMKAPPFQLFMTPPTGLQQTTYRFTSRRRKVEKVKRYRGFRMVGIQFSGLAPVPPVSTVSWVSPVVADTMRNTAGSA